VSDEGDAKILNEVQDRFDVNITELPDEIDLSSYSKLIGMEVLSYLTYAISYVLEGPALFGIQCTCGQLCMYIYIYIYIQGSLVEVQTPTQWNLIAHSTTTPLPVLPPSSILPLASYAYIATRKILAHISKLLLFQFPFKFFLKIAYV
jgi:hypothetical protein